MPWFCLQRRLYQTGDVLCVCSSRFAIHASHRFRLLISFCMLWQLAFCQAELKYFLEIMQNKKSDFLEWTIIVLIAAEICVSVYDLIWG